MNCGGILIENAEPDIKVDIMDIQEEVEVQEEIIFSERIRKVRKAVDKLALEKKFNKDRRLIYAHSYGVAQSAALLAKKRGLNVELSIIAGMLHDIHTLVYLDSKKHAHKGAKMAMKILAELDMFSPVEIAIIYTSIYNHSDKDVVNGVYDELLKDADVLQHVLFDPLVDVFPKEIKRYNRLIDELGFKEDHIPEVDAAGRQKDKAEVLNEVVEEVIQEVSEETEIEENLKNLEGAIEAAVSLEPLVGMEEIQASENGGGTPSVPADETETEDEYYNPNEDEELKKELSEEEDTETALADMSVSEAAKTYSKDPKQFEEVIGEINRYIEKINRVNDSIDEQNKVNDGGNELNGAAATEKLFVSKELYVPEDFWTDTFYFCKLTPELTELDYAAVMEAHDEIRRIYNITDPDEWPSKSLTLDEDKEDLIIHEKEFNERKAFAYSVFNLARQKCFGCFYISPCDKPEYDALITLWGLNSAITNKLYKDVRKFINGKFEFKNPAFPVFEIPIDEWEVAINPGELQEK